MTDFATDEASQSDSQPREIYEITHGVTSYYVAKDDRDIIYNSHTFVAAPSSRMELTINPLTVAWELQLLLPVTHPLVKRYLAFGGVPPKQITVTARRQQLTSGQFQQFHVGYITGMTIDGHMAKFRVPSMTSTSLDRNLPSVLVDSTCANILYDGWCTVARGSFAYTGTALIIDGRSITVDSGFAQADQWAQFGEFLHTPSGERMGIVSQVGRIVTLQYPIYELKAGDAIQLFAGCDHTITTCQSKFSNKSNFLGGPQRPTRDLFLPTGIGIEEQR